MLEKLKRDKSINAMKRIYDRIEKDPYAKTDIQKKQNINERKAMTLDLLLDYVIKQEDRIDWLDKDLCQLYDYVLCKDSHAREMFIMYLVNGNTIEYCNWKRLFEEWEYDKLIDKLELTDRPLSIMVVCCRVYVNAVLTWRRKFTCQDFNSVIDWCKWKKLDVY